MPQLCTRVRRIHFLVFCLLVSLLGQAQKPAAIPYRVGELWGYADSSGILLLPAVYKNTSLFQNGLAIVEGDSGWGCINPQGDTILPLQYGRVFPFSDDLAVVGLDTAWGVCDARGELIVPLRYQRIRSFQEGRAAAMRFGWWGYLDTLGLRVIPLHFELASDFHEGYAAVMRDNYWALIDRQGDQITDFIYEEIEYVPELGFRLRANNYECVVAVADLPYLKDYTLVFPPSEHKQRVLQLSVDSATHFGWSFIDSAGKKLSSLTFDWVGDFHEGRAVVRKGERLGYVDSTGTLRINTRYDEALPFGDGLALTKLKKGYGFLDQKGKKAIPHRFAQARPFSGPLATVTSDHNGWGGWHYIDRKGTPVGPEDFIAVSPFEHGCGIVCRMVKGQKRWGVLDEAGEFVLKPKYAGIWLADSTRLIVADFKDRLAVYDREGKKLLSFAFRSIVPLPDGKLFAVKNDRYYLYDHQQSLLAQGVGDLAEEIPGTGLLRVSLGKGQFGLITLEGEELVKTNLLALDVVISEGLLLAREGDKWGFLNVAGDWVIPPAYDSAKPFKGGLAIVLQDGKWGYIDRQGKAFFE